jgi:hypothetical protein
MRTLILLAVLSLLPAAPVAAADRKPASSPAGVFDRPLRTERVALGGGEAGQARKPRLTCYYFPAVRVKEVDLGEVGAAELAILPLRPGMKRIACQRRTAPGEVVIRSDQWSGYFKGVKSGYVFFDAEDGTNGGLGFAVFDGRTGRKLFEDLAVGEIRAAEASGAGIRLRYRRAGVGPCSVPGDGMKCWARIAEQMPGIKDAPAPDCAAGYQKAKLDMARGRCEAQGGKGEDCLQAEMKRLDEQHWNETPSVVAYDVEAQIDPGRQSLRATGGALSCWPAD